MASSIITVKIDTEQRTTLRQWFSYCEQALDGMRDSLVANGIPVRGDVADCLARMRELQGGLVGKEGE